jgi:hypothetical protein
MILSIFLFKNKGVGFQLAGSKVQGSGVKGLKNINVQHRTFNVQLLKRLSLRASSFLKLETESVAGEPSFDVGSSTLNVGRSSL